jgi:hypothetical protein
MLHSLLTNDEKSRQLFFLCKDKDKDLITAANFSQRLKLFYAAVACIPKKFAGDFFRTVV